jgi:lipoprotein-anchoring transpeptidase ErfK/SrfK
MNILKKFIAVLICFLFFACCQREQKNPIPINTFDSAQTVRDSLDANIKSQPLTPEINYLFYNPISKNAYKELLEKFDTLGVKIILAINRVNRNVIRKLDSLVVPDTILTDINDYSPFPHQVDILEKVSKLLIISQKQQAFAAYDYGTLTKWGPTSTGKKSTPTPNGLFHTNWKSKKTISTINEEWILKWYFNLDNFDGVSIHEYELPGYPASHSCARLLADDAKWIYYWAEQWSLTADGETIVSFGTPVIIFGDYNFKITPAWKLLPTEPDSARISEEELTVVIQKHIFTILKRQEEREKLLLERDLELVLSKN